LSFRLLGLPTAFEGSPRTHPVIASCRVISISDVETVSEEHAALIDRSFWFLFLAQLVGSADET